MAYAFDSNAVNKLSGSELLISNELLLHHPQKLQQKKTKLHYNTFFSDFLRFLSSIIIPLETFSFTEMRESCVFCCKLKVSGQMFCFVFFLFARKNYIVTEACIQEKKNSTMWLLISPIIVADESVPIFCLISYCRRNYYITAICDRRLYPRWTRCLSFHYYITWQ